MTFGEKLKNARTEAGYSQEQLAEKLMVSRSAVAKWESDRGMPDVSNLKLIAASLDVSIDCLLSDDGSLNLDVIKEPIDLSTIEPASKKKNPLFSSKDLRKQAAVRLKYPTADIYMLTSKQKNTKKEHILQDLLLLFTDAPANAVDIVHAVNNTNKLFFLVEEAEKQSLVLVTDEFIETRRLPQPVNKKKFDIGNLRFTNARLIKE